MITLTGKKISEGIAIGKLSFYKRDTKEIRRIYVKDAEKEDCVIVGRNADFILRNRSDVFNVFVYGNMPEKIKRICKLYDVTESEAAKMITDTDKRRMANYNFYTEQKWGI